MRIGAIDIGTNTVLLLIADIEADGRIRTVENRQLFARLGEGVDQHRRIRPESLQRASDAVSQYLDLCRSRSVDRVIACGTSAIRDAENRDEVVTHVKDRFNLPLEVLTGRQEAELTYLGAISSFEGFLKGGPFSVLDIGGGSTELTIGAGPRVNFDTSLDVGCVRLTERYLAQSPPAPEALAAAERDVRDHLAREFPAAAQGRFIGVAGTLTTLAALDLRLDSYNADRVTGHVMARETIDDLFRELSTKSTAELSRYPQIVKGREDILVAGIVILREVMHRLSTDRITASDRGLRYGMVLREGLHKGGRAG